MKSGIDPKEVIYMIVGSLSVGCSFVYARLFLADKNISAVALSTYQIGLGLLMLLLVTDLKGIEHILEAKIALTGLVLELGLTGTGLAYVLYYFIVQHLGAVKAASVTYIPPVVALMIGCLFAHEPLSTINVAAMLCILGGV